MAALCVLAIESKDCRYALQMKKSVFLVGAANPNLSGGELFPDLADAFSAKGFTLTDSPLAHFYVAVNHSPNHYKRFIANGGDHSRAVLIRLEPRAVYPRQYRPSVTSKYGLVINPGRAQPQFESEHFIGWPYEVVPNPQQPISGKKAFSQILDEALESYYEDFSLWKNRENALVMINANKVSPVKQEMYEVRRDYARNMPPQTMRVFGDLWNVSLLTRLMHRARVLVFNLRSHVVPNFIHIYGNLHWRFSNAEGPILDKSVILSATKFSLVIENDVAYVSEKLFDSLLYGAIPIYLGPNLESVGLPASIIIPLKRNPEMLWNQILEFDDAYLLEIWTNIKEFLNSDLIEKNWEKPVVFKKIVDRMEDHFFGSAS